MSSSWGGDSILSLQVLSRARKLQSQGLTLKLRDLMKHQTIAELAALALTAQSRRRGGPVLGQ
ncbi:phosphopantetheine-binding protein [Achromobacter sp. NPDC058515]|uniref:phosphopantetheine-binding protein n=1 Tax=Achromobacter sp. NPDC058515 TaxID=3346533 RepID=UPI00364D7A08